MLFCFVFVLVVCVVGFGIIYLILTFLVCLLRVVVFDYLLFTWLFGVVDTVAFGLVVWFDFVCGLCLVVRGIVIDGGCVCFIWVLVCWFGLFWLIFRGLLYCWYLGFCSFRLLVLCFAGCVALCWVFNGYFVLV